MPKTYEMSVPVPCKTLFASLYEAVSNLNIYKNIEGNEKEYALQVKYQRGIFIKPIQVAISLRPLSESETSVSITTAFAERLVLDLGGDYPLFQEARYPIVNQIETLTQAFKEATEKISEGLLCPTCGKELIRGTHFCPNDGTPIAIVCESCGFNNSPSAMFCSNCGKRV